MSIEAWLLFLLVGLAPAVSPGPGMLFTTSTALRYGPYAGVVTGMANAVGLAVLGVAVALGVSAVMAASAIAFLALKLVGAGYLIYLGVKVWRDRSAFLIDAERAPAAAPARKLALQALLIALTNPKAMVLLAALLPPFMIAGEGATAQAVKLSLAYAALCACCHFLIAIASGALRRLLTTPRRAAVLRRVVGGAFLGFGAALAASARA